MKDFSIFETPISTQTPAGIDIEYDSRFLEIQRLSEGKPEQQFGDTIIEGEGPDWATIEKLCTQLLSESKDLRVLCFYTQALTARYGIAGFKAGCEAISKNIDNYWDEIYPLMVDEDNEPDSFYRINALNLLLSEVGVIKQLNNAKLLNNALSGMEITFKQALMLLHDSSAIDYHGGKDRLILDIQIAVDSGKQELLLLKDALSFIENIEQIYENNIKDNQTLSFEIIKNPIYLILSFESETPLEIGLQENSYMQLNEQIQSSRAPTKTEDWRKVSLSDRKDVELMLEKICMYFEDFEPSHPAPLLIRRVQRLMKMNFYDIVKDISPENLEKLDILIGKPLEE